MRARHVLPLGIALLIAPSALAAPGDAPTTPTPAAEVVAPAPAAAATGPLLWIEAVGGGGFALQDDLADQRYLDAGVSVDYDLGSGMLLGASFDYRMHEAVYSSRTATIAGSAGFAATTEEEMWLDARLAFSYNTLETVTDIMALRVGLAPRYVASLNDGFPTWSFAPEVFLRADVPATSRLSFSAGFHFGFPAVGTKNDEADGAYPFPSIHGTPAFLYDYDAGLSLDITDSKAVSLLVRWQAHTVVYKFAQRDYHGGLIGLQIGL